jgi:hypothetical protein
LLIYKFDALVGGVIAGAGLPNLQWFSASAKKYLQHGSFSALAVFDYA